MPARWLARCATTCTWYDGQDFVFDGTYPHLASNGSSSPRLILLCDVDWPLNVFGRLVHLLCLRIAKAMLVANTSEASRVLFSLLFAALAPLRQQTLRLSQTSRPA